MDATGTRFAVAHKDVHAQSFGASGAVRFVDSGFSLQTTSTPRIGGELAMAARLPGATGGFFLMGAPGRRVLSFPGVAGELLLDRRSLRVIAAPVDATGRMDLGLPIGADASLLGVRMNVQGAFRTPQGLARSERLERPYVLPLICALPHRRDEAQAVVVLEGGDLDLVQEDEPRRLDLGAEDLLTRAHVAEQPLAGDPLDAVEVDEDEAPAGLQRASDERSMSSWYSKWW